MAGTIEEKITELVEPLVTSMDLQLWGIRYHASRDHAVLQIFIEAEDGVGADQCGDVVNMVSPALDAADLIAPAYTLEVSSPGLDRILFSKEQAAEYVGENVKIELKIPSQGRHKFVGTLKEVSDDGILKVDDQYCGLVELAFSNISVARLIPSFPKNNKKAPKSTS